MKPLKFYRVSSATLLALALLDMTPVARASITLGAPGDRTACPDPSFNACYIGVDGSRAATVDANSTSMFSFVGLGVQSSELSAVTFPGMPPTGPTMPNGSLTVSTGASLQVGGSVNPARPYDASIVVGLGNNSTGSLLVAGGQVTTPVLVIGEYDGVRTSTGQVTLANVNGATDNLVSRITVTADSSVNGPLPGFTAIQIGRGLGSTGDLDIGYGDVVSAISGSVSIGRAGTGSLEIGDSATFSTAGSVYASSGDINGVSNISVNGALNLGVGGHLLLGIAADPATTGLNQGFLRQSDPGGANHGSATLTLLNNGVVNGDVVLGTGGRIQGNGTVNNLTSEGGYISPGFSPGKITVDGNFVMDGGTYLVQIAGTGADMIDLVDVMGSASISNATILFSFIDGFSPLAGENFDFLDALGGTTLSNVDFEVEGLLAGFGYTTTNANGTLSINALTNGVAVPEPESLALLAVGFFGAALIRRRRVPKARDSVHIAEEEAKSCSS